MRLFTSESVTEGHPDKLADQISDSILDEILRQDPEARTAIETVATTGLVHVVGEVTTSAYADISGIVRQTIIDVGYDRAETYFDGNSIGVTVSIGSQSPDIGQGVDQSLESRTEQILDPFSAQGAGDQGIMFGYATNETKELMPLPITLAHRLAERLAKIRKDGTVDFLYPDGKTQVTIAYEGDRAIGVDTVVISSQHSAQTSQQDLAEALKELVVTPVLAEHGFDASASTLLFNPTGKFVIGGPMGDAGLTGRKIIIDTYGGSSRHGGGAFSGKDPSKVDRSAAYALRWAAKNAVAAGLADRLELQLAYAIGKAAPVGLYAETFGTGKLPEEEIIRAIQSVFDFRPAAIIDTLDLKRPIYRETARYGHFGRNLPDFSWEHLNRVDELREVAKL